MKVFEKPNAFYEVFERKSGPAKEATHYCPGCGHGNIHKMIAEALEDLGLTERSVFVSPVGCSVFGYYYFNCGNYQAAHGRAPAVATAVKRTNPNSIVMSYQGDGDLAAIGTAETIHAANRGENITVFFVNNAIYGMTGGQMAPTTMIGQRSATTPQGRRTEAHGNPIRMAEMLATLPAPTYIERVAIGHSKHILKAKKAIRKALKIQAEGKGYSFIEIVSACPTGWKMDPVMARDWLVDDMLAHFPLGVLKDESHNTDEGTWDRICDEFDPATVNAYLDRMKSPFDGNEDHTLNRDLQCKFAGFGGQGILTLGLFLSQIGMRAGHQVSWFPAYGPEMRGGTANCSVNVSAKRIGTPLVDHPNVLVVMNQPSLDTFEKDVVDGGTIIVDTTVVEGRPDAERLNVVLIPASDIADEVGTPKVANVVVLGALCAATDAFDAEFAMNTLKAVIKKRSLIDMNMTAFMSGYDFVKNGK
ncbi:2-ketoisovalerate ferredoxin oxidoreductase [bacterium DOLJORAL78_65_58]|nr:MAG: 2-ketoisovalerate ferredoxin oxidoreductase [bacterium DOLZORAL124_64_63]PIE76505.1 MAG: 2-ketoisovalerate ferredoxin oxidoreductase [bacterium DOLJORAL78_65_58]